MEKMVVQYGVTVVSQRLLQLRRHLAGTLAGAMEEVEQETREAGVTSRVEAGGRTLKKPREAGMPPALLPRIHRLVLGAELLAQLVLVKEAVTAWKDIPGKETPHREIIQLLCCLPQIWTPGCCVTLAGDRPLFASTPPGTWTILSAKMQMRGLSHGVLAHPLQVMPRGPPTLTWAPLRGLTLGAEMMCLVLRELQVGVEA